MPSSASTAVVPFKSDNHQVAIPHKKQKTSSNPGSKSGAKRWSPCGFCSRTPEAGFQKQHVAQLCRRRNKAYSRWQIQSMASKTMRPKNDHSECRVRWSFLALAECFFVRVVRFYKSSSPLLPSPPPLPAPDRRGHRWTSTASSWSQCCSRTSSQPRTPDLSGHCRTPTASSRSQWALPDPNRQLPRSVGIARPEPISMPDRMSKLYAR